MALIVPTRRVPLHRDLADPEPPPRHPVAELVMRPACAGMRISPQWDLRAVLLTNKLYCTRDRKPVTDVRNAFRALTFN